MNEAPSFVVYIHIFFAYSNIPRLCIIIVIDYVCMWLHGALFLVVGTPEP